MFKTNQPKETKMPMIKIEPTDHISKKKAILKILNQAQQVFVYNGILEYHFKTSKTELLHVFKTRYESQLTVKQSDGSLDLYYMNEFLDEFKDNCSLNEHNQLFFN